MERKATYMVVELHSAYAVVLDNSGRFIKVANSGYAVGDVTDKIVPLIYPQDKKKRKSTIIRLAASLAACVALCIFGTYEYQYMYTEYGSIHMQINPEVEISLSRSGRVLNIEGENADGEALLQDYSYKGKDKETVVDELADLAIEQNYLTEGGQIAVSVDARSDEWADKIETEILDELNRYLQEQNITIEIIIGSLQPPEKEETKEVLDEAQTVTITVPQTSDKADSTDSGYDNNEDDGITDYSAPSVSSPSSPAQNDSGYDSTDSGSNNSSKNSSYGSGNDSPYDSSSESSPYDDSGDSSYSAGNSSNGSSSYDDDDDDDDDD